MHQHGLSRRVFLKAGAATAGLVATSGLLSMTVDAKSGIPRPVPPDDQFFGLRVFGPDPTTEPSTITDFHGQIGAAIVDGTGTWKVEGKPAETLNFDTDMRFMQGVFRGTDGRDRNGTFGFI